jgi:hypothetical protein
VLLALCIVALVMLWNEYKHAGMVQDLKRYDLDNFKQTEWTDLKVKVEVDHELITAYGLQKAVRDTVNETLQENARHGRTHYHQRRRKKGAHTAAGVGRVTSDNAGESADSVLQR